MFKIEDNKLITTETVFGINKSTDKISVLTNTPISSLVECVVNGFDNPYKIILLYTHSTTEGNVFEYNFLLDDTCINYIKHNPDKEYTFCIFINKIPVKGSQKVYFGNKLTSNYYTPDVVVLKELAKIEQYLTAFKSNNQIVNPLMAKGMMPIATGKGNEYLWDYPFTNIEQRLKELVTIVVDLSNANKELTTRLNKLEQDYLDSKYEKYNII